MNPRATRCTSLVARPPYGALGDRALQPHCSCPPLAGVGGGHPELVEGLPAGTVGNRSLQPHYMLAEKVDIVGTVA
jgi:hypothetical protein